VLVLAGIATGNKIGLAAVAAVFIAFALLSSFVAPRRWPDFPGRQGLSVFVIASVVLFAAMLTAIIVLAVENEHEAEAAGNEPAAGKTIDVRESEFKIALPAQKDVVQGDITFVVRNEGQTEHDLVVEGPELSGDNRTAIIAPGGEAKLTVTLGHGIYTLYCSVDGHRQSGMEAKLAVG
jgi:uncharacterized cupredoxin-like copper-binding protein